MTRFARGLGSELVIFLLAIAGGGAQAPQTPSSGAGRIAFVSTRDGSEQIYVMDADGSNVARLTNAPGANWSPTFSPDGRKLAFSSNRDGEFQIYVMDADGSHVTRLTSPPGRSEWPKFSPDGGRIVFGSSRDGDFQIYVMSTDGSNVIRLTSPPGINGVPRFSPDGTRIVFTSKRDADYQIYLMNADGSSASPVTIGLGESADATFSPDGRKIAFVSKGHIYIADADGSHVTRLTNPTGENGFPTFSPDGTKIAFASKRDGSQQIYAMGADGSNVTRLTNSPGLNYDPSYGTSRVQLPPSPPLLQAAAMCAVDPAITPGVGIGRIKLSASLTELMETFAAPSVPARTVTGGDSTFQALWYARATDLGIVTQDNNIVEITLGVGTQDTQKCATREGIHVGGATVPVKTAYGEPQGIFSLPNTNIAWWVYNNRGIALIVNTQGQVLAVSVFAPGMFCKLQEHLSKLELGGPPAPPGCGEFKPPLS